MNQHNHRQFAATLRQEPVSDDKLRESLQANGWFPHLPAKQDEHGNILEGNRRLRIARELGIEPVIITIPFGEGEEADKQALKLAILSNEARAPFSKADRKRIAMHLYGEKGWTMQRIAESLGVHTSTVGHDLEEFSQTRKLPRAENRGRPKGIPSKKQKVRRINAPHEAIERLEQQAKAKGVSVPDLLGEMVEPTIERSELSLTAQQKLDAAIRQAQRKVEADHAARVRQLDEEVRQRVVKEGTQYRARMQEREEEARNTVENYHAMTNRHQPLFSVEQFKTILMCLHPDGERSSEKLAEAFRLFNACKFQLTGRK